MVRHNISIYFCQKQKKWNNINIFILEKKNYQSERYEKWTDFIFDDGRNLCYWFNYLFNCPIFFNKIKDERIKNVNEHRY